jgi:hypothetical protein
MAFNKLKKEAEIVISEIFRDVFEGDKVWDTYLDFDQFKEMLNKLNFINSQKISPSEGNSLDDMWQIELKS